MRLLTKLILFFILFLTPYFAIAAPSTAGETPQIPKSESVLIVYKSTSKAQSLVRDGILSQIPRAAVIDLDSEAQKLSSVGDGDYAVVVPVGKSALDATRDFVKKTPIVFSVVSGPRYFGYQNEKHITGVTGNVPMGEYYEVLQKILPAGATIGFIYKDDITDYLVSEIDFIEGRYGLRSVKNKIADRDAIGPTLRRQIEEMDIKAFWMMSDSLYNIRIFRKLAALCREKKILLITNYETLVTDAGAAIAIAPSYFEIGLQTAEIAKQVAYGRNAGEIPIQGPQKTAVYVNQETIADLKIKLPQEVINREKITALFELGTRLFQEGKTQEGLNQFNAILKIDPLHTGALNFKTQIDSRIMLARGREFIKQGKPALAIPQLVAASATLAEARQELIQLKAQMITEVPKIFAAGRDAYQRKDYYSCIEKMSLVLEFDPGHPEAGAYLDKAKKGVKAITNL